MAVCPGSAAAGWYCICRVIISCWSIQSRAEHTLQSPRTQNNNGASRGVPFIPVGLSCNQYICSQIIVLLVQLDLYSHEPIVCAEGLETMPQPGLLSSHCHCSRTPVLGVIVQAASYLWVLPADVGGRGQFISFFLWSLPPYGPAPARH